MVKEKQYTISFTEKELKLLINVVNSPYSYDNNCSPNETQFGYCSYCYNVEYKDHEKDCPIPFLQQKIKSAK